MSHTHCRRAEPCHNARLPLAIVHLVLLVAATATWLSTNQLGERCFQGTHTILHAIHALDEASILLLQFAVTGLEFLLTATLAFTGTLGGKAIAKGARLGRNHWINGWGVLALASWARGGQGEQEFRRDFR